MKLRNKKTGEIGELSGVNRIVVYEYDMPPCRASILGEYDTLAEFNEDWEDYKPAEPLIKDEKIRKAVRAWAEANDYSLIKISNDMAYEPNCGNVQIHFEDVNIVNEDKYGVHTIAELCGEEE